MIRRLLDPTAGEGGGGAAPPATPATPVTPAAPPQGQATPPTPPPQQTPAAITLTHEQHKAFLEAIAERDRYRQAENEREVQKKQADEDQLRKKGEYDKLIAARDEDLKKASEKAAAIEDRSKKYVLDRELALAIASGNVMDGWPPHLIQLWRDKFEVQPDGDGWKVQTLDGKTPSEFVKAQLALPEYSPLVKAGSQGGAPHRGDAAGRAPATPEGLDPSKPGNAAYARWLEGQNARTNAGFAPMGL